MCGFFKKWTNWLLPVRQNSLQHKCLRKKRKVKEYTSIIWGKTITYCIKHENYNICIWQSKNTFYFKSDVLKFSIAIFCDLNQNMFKTACNHCCDLLQIT